MTQLGGLALATSLPLPLQLHSCTLLHSLGCQRLRAWVSPAARGCGALLREKVCCMAAPGVLRTGEQQMIQASHQ